MTSKEHMEAKAKEHKNDKWGKEAFHDETENCESDYKAGYRECLRGCGGEEVKHPTPEQLENLIEAVDVACWTWAVKQNTKKGQKCVVDWKSALQDLNDAWHMYQLRQSDAVAVFGDVK